jgi:hypothetical protein
MTDTVSMGVLNVTTIGLDVDTPVAPSRGEVLATKGPSTAAPDVEPLSVQPVSQTPGARSAKAISNNPSRIMMVTPSVVVLNDRKHKLRNKGSK